MNNLNFGNISLKSFVDRVDSSTSKVSEYFRKYMHEGAFALLWEQCDTSVVRVYVALGRVFHTVQALSEHPHMVRQRLARRPMCGLVRAATNYGEDFRFVAFAHADNVYIVLENSAKDSKLELVWVYDEDADMFVPGGSSFPHALDFLIRQEVAVA